MDDPAAAAAAAAREAERLNEQLPNAVREGQPIGECPDCGERFDYGSHTGAGVSNLDPCPECGSQEWCKWGYRHHGTELRRDEAWDQYDKPPSANESDRGGEE